MRFVSVDRRSLIALACGLVSRVVPAERLLDEALAAATTIAGFSLPSLMMAKEAINRAFETSLASFSNSEKRRHATNLAPDAVSVVTSYRVNLDAESAAASCASPRQTSTIIAPAAMRADEWGPLEEEDS